VVEVEVDDRVRRLQGKFVFKCEFLADSLRVKRAEVADPLTGYLRARYDKTSQYVVTL
jgi:hypothetical protein